MACGIVNYSSSFAHLELVKPAKFQLTSGGESNNASFLEHTWCKSVYNNASAGAGVNLCPAWGSGSQPALVNTVGHPFEAILRVE